MESPKNVRGWIPRHRKEPLPDNRIGLVFFGLILVLYLLTMQTGLFWGDPIEGVKAATATERSFPPQHLLSSTVNASILALFGIDREPATFLLLRVVMILATLSGTWGFFLLLRRFRVDRVVLFGILSLYLLANGVWYHSTTVETGAIPLSLLVWSLYWLLRTDVSTRLELFFSFALVSLSVLFNLQQALFIPLFLAYALTRLWRTPGFFYSVLLIGSTIVVIGIFPYLLIAVPAHDIRSITDFVSWLTYHPNAEEIGKMRTIGVESFGRSLSGLFTMVVDAQGATSWLKFRMRGEEGIGTNLAFIVRLAMPALILAGLVLHVVFSASERKQIAFLTILSLFSCFLFGLAWLGSDPQFWLPVWPLLLLSAGIGLTKYAWKRTRSRRIMGVIFTICSLLLFLMNVPRTSPSLLFPNGGTDFQHAQVFAGIVERGDVVITAGGKWSNYVETLRPDAEVINLGLRISEVSGAKGEEVIAILEDRIECSLARGRAVYIEGTVDSPDVLWSSAWEGFRLKYDLPRHELMEGLKKSFRFSNVPDYQVSGMAKIER